MMSTMATAERIPSLLVVPLCDDLPCGDTWPTWAAELIGLEEVSSGTISGQIIARAGPAWLYGLHLPRILSGALNADPDYGADARAALAAFEDGRPLYIGVLGSVERYGSFDPTLTYTGNHSYAVGSDPPRAFSAANHVQALEQAGDWYRALRARETDAQKGRARSLRLSLLAVDLLAAALTHRDDAERVLYDTDGELLVWENMAHGRYGVQGSEWCYLIHASPVTAVRLGYLALAESRAAGDPRAWDAGSLVGAVPQLLGLRGWGCGTDTATWEGAEPWSVAGGTKQWQIRYGGTPYLRVALAHHEGLDTPVLTMEGPRGAAQKMPVPPGWQLTHSDLVAWTIYHAQRSRKESKKGGSSGTTTI